MKKRYITGLLACVTAGVAGAHVPYLERTDYSPQAPFVVEDPPHSIAAYAWLQDGADADVFTMTITNPTPLYVGILVPVAPAYVNFFPKFAIIGPGLPAPSEALPVSLPAGHGAIVMNYAPGDRETMFEPFGGKFYFVGPEFDETVSATGTWQVVVWDPQHKRGDYVLAIGKEEGFSGPDMVRAIVNTKIIRANEELHIPAVNMRPRRK
jgi:hypothetical protein